MLTVDSSVLVAGITGSEITEFMLSPTDDRYRAWWPGTHLQFHVVSGSPSHMGDVVWMDEYVGSRRLRMTAVVVDIEPGHRIVWQLKRWVRLPAWVRVELADETDGCRVHHVVEVGYRGIGRVLDPMLRLFLSRRFASELADHVRTEFTKLRDYLHSMPATAPGPRPPRPRRRRGAGDRSQWGRWPADARSGRVVFVSHCLLNENVRYPGGATRPGAVREVLTRYVDAGVGLCQMPCPEQRAWGGVRKRNLRHLYGCRVLRWRLVRRALLTTGTAWTRAVYRRLARRIAGEVADYVASGFEVVEIVGVGGSPSCGVRTTLDLDGAVAAMARHGPDSDRRAANRDIVTTNVVPGSGLFIECLERALQSRGLTIAYGEHDLVSELTRAGAVAPSIQQQ
jgi:predicted secreted protein